jgi:His/Glu/Gln/Arg/opine family amino acid ABC transporter permease subunit
VDHPPIQPTGDADLSEDTLIRARQHPLSARISKLPLWLIGLFLISIWVGLAIYLDADYREVFNFMKPGLVVTITTTLIAYAIALVFGLLAGLGRISRNIIVNNVATFYVEIIRGIPILVLIFYIALVGVPSVVDGINALGDLTLGIHRLTEGIDLNTLPAWSPNGEQIAFTSQNQEDKSVDLYLLEVREHDVTRLTDNANENSAPTWSPDGEQIAFLSEDEDDSDIYLIDSNGGNMRALVETPANEVSPVWSPDGTKIAFLSEREDSLFDIFRVNVDGSDLVQLTGDVPAYGKSTDGLSNLSWSPDGRQIAFMAKDESGNVDVYVMDADGGDVTRLTDSPGDDVFPVWSPDGERIAFTSKRGGVYLNIYTMKPDGSGLVRVTDEAADHQDVQWSPDGERIAFTSRSAGNLDIYIVNADGSDLRRMMYTRGEDKSPNWSPDGRYLAYVSARSSNPDIYTVTTARKPLAVVGRVFTSFDNQAVPLHLRAIIALAVTYGAFLAEIFRAGIQSIGRGQMEAARSLGMSYGQSMRHIILPQAIRNMLPALGNDFVAMVKDSSLVSVLAVRDITQRARLHAGTSFRYRESYTTLAALYLSMTVILSLLVGLLERRLRSDE